MRRANCSHGGRWGMPPPSDHALRFLFVLFFPFECLRCRLQMFQVRKNGKCSKILSMIVDAQKINSNSNSDHKVEDSIFVAYQTTHLQVFASQSSKLCVTWPVIHRMSLFIHCTYWLCLINVCYQLVLKLNLIFI